jgi:hypothetical protein
LQFTAADFAAGDVLFHALLFATIERTRRGSR